MDENPNREREREQEQESLRFKEIAEAKFSNSNIKSSLKYAKKAHSLNPSLEGISSMITALKILKVASKDDPEWYSVLQVEPFSHINTIKKQYKKLALLLHPDKNTFVGCEDAFKLFSEGFRVLSDKIRRKEYDMKLRIRLQEERVSNIGGGSLKVETFWTCCARCRLLHQFEKRYLGHNLVCPSCKKSFKAVEVDVENEEDEGGGVGSTSEKVRDKVSNLREKSGGGEGIVNLGGKKRSGEKVGGTGLGRSGGNEGDGGVWSGGRLRPPGLKRKIFSVDEVLERPKPKKVKVVDEEMMTLAEMQLEAKKKASKERSKLEEKEKQNVEKEKKKKNVEKNRHVEKKKKDDAIVKNIVDVDREKTVALRKSRDEENNTREVVTKSKNVDIERNSELRKSLNLKIEERGVSKSGGSKKMEVADSDFYDFEKDRVERSFKKGQVWAIYDDDGMPRHYGLIDEVISVNPFQVKLSWLDFQTNGDQLSIGWQKIGFRVPCGRYKVGKTTITRSLNVFSHVVECERAAREVYRIYPKKGSVWAAYSEADMDTDGRNLSTADKQHYDIVIVLSNYSEVHGLSTAYLEKVDGFKTVFKRRDIGFHAVRLLEKDDLRLFSHQILSRKLSGNDVPDLLKDCWELDPASLPSELLLVEWKK